MDWPRFGRVVLKPFSAGLSEAEWKGLYETFRDPEVAEWNGSSPLRSPFWLFKRFVLAEARRKDRVAFVILDEKGEYLGTLELYDLTPEEARRFFAGMVGRSTHAPEQALRALEEGVDYLSVGPVWETPTKPGRPAAGLAYVRWAAENLGEKPWYAIAGIDLGNLDQVLEAGARRIVVVRAILDAPDPERAARALRERLYGVA